MSPSISSKAASHDTAAVAKSCLALKSRANKCHALTGGLAPSWTSGTWPIAPFISSSRLVVARTDVDEVREWTAKASLTAAMAPSKSRISARTNPRVYNVSTLYSSSRSGWSASLRFDIALLCKSAREAVS